MKNPRSEQDRTTPKRRGQQTGQSPFSQSPFSPGLTGDGRAAAR